MGRGGRHIRGDPEAPVPGWIDPRPPRRRALHPLHRPGRTLSAGLCSQNVDAIRVGPAALAYTSYLLATAPRGTFADGFAAVLPCYWIYAEVGAELVGRGSPDPRYQRWIDTYAGDEYQTIVAEV